MRRVLWIALQPRPLGVPCTLPVEPDAEGDDALGGAGHSCAWREVEGWTRLAALPVSKRAGEGAAPGTPGTALDPPFQREDGGRRFTRAILVAWWTQSPNVSGVPWGR